MKKIVFLISLILTLTAALKAQVKTIYYMGDRVISDTTLVSSFSTSFAVYGKLSTDSLYFYKRYDIENNLMITGSFMDEGLKIPHGKFKFYNYVATFNDTHNTAFTFIDKNIFVSEEGAYDNGVNSGRWTSYYPDGKVFKTVKFENGLKQGEFVAYDEKGRTEILGNYIDDKREGEWLLKRGKRKVFFVNDIEQKKVSGNVKIN